MKIMSTDMRESVACGATLSGHADKGSSATRATRPVVMGELAGG